MCTSTLGLFLRHLALSEEASRLGTTSDHNLLAAYELGHSQAAFTELMRRYGPMVLRTCRRVLGPGPDAEDAFQATFVLLASKAGRLRRETAGRRSLGGWLHHVAYQTARQVLRGSVRRRGHEQQASAVTHAEPDPFTEATWHEIRPILDSELDALPDQARRLLIAFYLEEKTYTEMSAELGLPRSSLARHLEQARTLLARRLARRGITVSAGLLAILLEETAKGGSVPAVLLVHTVEAARKFSEYATGIASDHVARLVKSGLAQMSKGWTHLSMAVVGWVGLLGAGLIACQTLKAWPDQTPEAKPPAAEERPVRERDRSVRTDCFGDLLPPGALARMGTTRLRHTNEVYHVLFAPDGKTVASAGTDDTVRLWDVATGKLVHSLRHPPPVHMLRPASFSQDGKTLISATSNRFWLWDVRTGRQLREPKPQPNQWLASLTVSPDGKMAASLKDAAAIQLWDVASSNPLCVLEGLERQILSFCFSSDNKTVASVEGGEHGVRLWDARSGKLLHKLEQPRVVGVAVCFSPDGKTLASGGSDRPMRPLPNAQEPSAVRLWDVATGKLLRTLQGHGHAITALSFSPDGKQLASASWDKTVRLWDVTAAKELRSLQCSHVRSLSFAADGKVLALADSGPGVRLWDVATGEELHAEKGHTGKVCSIALSPDSRILATAAARGEGDGIVRFWDAASGKPIRSLKHPGESHALAFAPDGKTLASAGAGVVHISDASTGKPRHRLQTPDVWRLVFSPDSKLLAACSVNKGDGRTSTVRLWDAVAGTLLRALECPSPAKSAAFSPDGKALAVGTWGGTLHLWDAAAGKELRQTELKQFNERLAGEVTALSFSPDGERLAVGTARDKVRTIHLLEVSTGKELHTFTLTGHSGLLWSLAFSPSGRLLASGGSDRTVRLWEVDVGLSSPCHEFRGHDAAASALAFSPDGRRLTSGSSDSTALVWDVTGLAEGQTRAARLALGELTASWRALTSADAARAFQAMRTLAAAPEQVVPFLTERLREQMRERPDPRQIAGLLADLDSEDYLVRSRAAEELEKKGEAAVPALQKALRGNPSAEVRLRIKQLLDALHPGGVARDALRWSRALEVLEWIDNSAAWELLEKVSAAPPRAEVGRQAQAALKRLRALHNKELTDKTEPRPSGSGGKYKPTAP